MDNKILLVEDATISEESILKLEQHGYIVINIKDASKIKLLTDLSAIGTDKVYQAALATLQKSTVPSVIQDFATTLLKSIPNK